MEYIKIPIDVIDEYDDYLKGKFNGLRAWIDLLLLAKSSDTFARIRGIKVDVKRGQLAQSCNELAERWGWSKTTVTAFLRRLEEQKRISTQKNKVITLISIIEYEKYIGDFENCPAPPAMQIDTQVDTQNGTQNSFNINKLGSTTGTQIGTQSDTQSAIQTATQDAKKPQSDTQIDTQNGIQNGTQNDLSVNELCGGTGTQNGTQSDTQKDKDEIKKEEKVFPTPLPKEEINKEETENKKAKKLFFGERKPTRPPVTHPIEERKQWLVESIKKADNGIPRDMLNDFYLYWTETTPGGLKMRFELEKTWVTSMRLARWYKNNRK